MQRFVGKTVIVTGAASGFGKAMTRRFCAEGATVIAADINEAGAQALAKDIGEAAVPIKTDVRSLTTSRPWWIWRLRAAASMCW